MVPSNSLHAQWSKKMRVIKSKLANTSGDAHPQPKKKGDARRGKKYHLRNSLSADPPPFRSPASQHDYKYNGPSCWNGLASVDED